MKKKIEAILNVYYVAPHAPAPGTTWKHNRCGDCFCTIQTLHTHSTNVQYVKPLMELLEEAFNDGAETMDKVARNDHK